MPCVFEAKWSWPQINCIIADENVHRQSLDKCSFFITECYLQNQAEVQIWYLMYSWLMTKMEPLSDYKPCFQRFPQRLHAYTYTRTSCKCTQREEPWCQEPSLSLPAAAHSHGYAVVCPCHFQINTVIYLERVSESVLEKPLPLIICTLLWLFLILSPKWHQCDLHWSKCSHSQAQTE